MQTLIVITILVFITSISAIGWTLKKSVGQNTRLEGVIILVGGLCFILFLVLFGAIIGLSLGVYP